MWVGTSPTAAFISDCISKRKPNLVHTYVTYAEREGLRDEERCMHACMHKRVSFKGTGRLGTLKKSDICHLYLHVGK